MRTKSQNFILVSVLIISLVVLYSPILPVLAEGEETPPADPPAGEAGTPSETPSNTPADSSGAPDTSSQAEESAELAEDCPPPTSGQIAEDSPLTDTVIDTGEVNSEVGVENTVNSNITDSEQNSEIVSQSEDCGDCPSQPEEIASPSQELVEDNQAEVENEVEQLGLSGENQIGTEENPVEDDAIITTGNINLYVGIINTVNSNIIGSKISQLLFNIFENSTGDIFVPDELASSTESECLENACSNEVIDNEGEIENEVEINASSGSNSAHSRNGNAFIQTGNVNVVTDIFNVLNSNILGSNWTRFIINIFGNWIGDLVLPGKEAMQNFIENQSSSCGSGCDAENIVASNSAEIENNVDVYTDTGENQASGNPAQINTGNANVDVNALNVANSNITHHNMFFAAINNFGKWQGNIFSLPEGFNLSGDINGIKIFNSGPNGLIEETGSGSQNLVEDNSGSIENAVIINVLTGNNSAGSENGEAGIRTGHANVVANLINILNSNLTGVNMLIGLINIFGSWQGDLAFGRPDLWIGESVQMENNPAEVDERITYTLTYYNAGDADATGVVLTDDFDENSIGISDPGSGVVFNNPGEIQWDLGTIPPGGYGAVSYTAVVLPGIPFGVSRINNQAVIDSFEDDDNGGDNTENFSINAIKRYVQPNPVLVYPAPPQLEIKKSSNVVDFVYPGTIVDYVLEITNNSDSQAYRVVVTDVLINDLPEPIYTNAWNLDYVFPNEKIIISYQVYIGSEVPPGLYTNYAQASGFYVWGDPIYSNEASLTIEVKAPPVVGNVEEEVASAEVETTPEEIGNVGIGEELGVVEIEQETEELEEPEVLAAKTSGSRIRALQYFGFEFDEWIYLILLVILSSAAVLFVVLYANDLRKVRE